jgi:short subunit dehydrogenase-like uncharacterized protein
VKTFCEPTADTLDIEICELNDANLSALAKKTKLLISTVGPYALYGEHAFKACAENGTHYLDVTGEVAFTLDMIKKYEQTAKTNGSIMIPQIGIESAPSDLVTWSLVTMIREKFSAPTGEVILSVYDFRQVIFCQKYLNFADPLAVGRHLVGL